MRYDTWGDVLLAAAAKVRLHGVTLVQMDDSSERTLGIQASDGTRDYVFLSRVLDPATSTVDPLVKWRRRRRAALVLLNHGHPADDMDRAEIECPECSQAIVPEEVLRS